MSQLSRTNFEALYGSSGTQFPDNSSGAITELVMRTFGKNLSDSFWNSVTDFQKQTTATGTDTYAVTGGISAYASGFTIAVLFTNANTGTATLNVNSLGAKSIKKSGTTALASGDIAAGEIKILQYDGTNFQIIGGSGSGGGGTAATTTFTPGGDISATDVQGAIEELDSEKEVAGAAADALSDANDYTDAAITQEVIDRDAAISTALSGLSWKNVRAATTVAGTLATSFENGDTVDGVTLATGDRILLKNQADPKENGIRVVAASGAPSRATDADTNAELQNSAVLVAEGTANAGTAWVQTQSSINIGSTNIIFQQLGSSVPNADASTRGIAKLYTSTGSNTDGSMDQNSINTALASKEGITNKDDTGGYAGLTLFKINFKNALNTFTSFFTNANTAARTYTFQDRNGTIADDTDLALKANLAGSKIIQLAASDETTALAAGTGKITFRMPYAMTLTAVRASLGIAQASGSIFTVDINEAGSTILSTKLTIDNTEKTSTTAATAPVISDAALADDAEITIDIDQIGDGTAKGLKITLIGS